MQRPLRTGSDLLSNPWGRLPEMGDAPGSNKDCVRKRKAEFSWVHRVPFLKDRE